MAALLIPWYAREDWEQILLIMDDAPHFPANYDEWTSQINDSTVEAYLQGARIQHVRVKPKDFLEWCRLYEVRPGSKSRMEFVRHIAETQDIRARKSR